MCDRRAGEIRPYPYPFAAALAISSDLDGTRDWREYLELTRFISTDQDTSVGRGLGLGFANSIYFQARPNLFSYWGASAREREHLHALIRSGHVDTLHSFGDLALGRPDALRALRDLERNRCRLPVWVDHARAPTNLGLYQTRGGGDLPGHPAYHADAMVRHGVSYCWRGQVTGLIGQDVPLTVASLQGPYTRPVAAAREAAKIALSAMGGGRYGMHARNRTLRRVRLRDGAEMFEFLRCNAHPSGVSFGHSPIGLPEALSDAVVTRLIARGGTMVLYTHLGRLLSHLDQSVARPCRDALSGLARRQAEGALLVLSTARLLDYLAVRDGVVIHRRATAGGTSFDIDCPPGDLLTRAALDRRGGEGLSLRVEAEGGVRIRVAGREVEELRIVDDPQGAGRLACIPLGKQKWPDL